MTRYRTLYKYIWREYLLSFFVALAFFFFIFFINQLLLMAEEILSKRVPFADVSLLILYSLPSILAISFPFSSLVGALMTVGRFSSDREMLAVQASGIPRRTVFFPILLMALVIAFGSFLMNDILLPVGTVKFGRLYRELIYSNPELELESYSVKNYQDTILITGRVDERRIDTLMIIDKTSDQDKRVITAEEAELVENPENENVVTLRLDSVTSHTSDRMRPGFFSYSSADSMLYNILLSDITVAIREPGPREMSSRDVRSIIEEKEKELEKRKEEYQQLLDRLAYQYISEHRRLDQLSVSQLDKHPRNRLVPVQQQTAAAFSDYNTRKDRKITDRSLQIHRLEYHKKFSIPFGCLFFVFIAFPAGLFTQKSGRAVGFGLGLLISMIYWGLLVGGQTMGLRMGVNPVFAMWLPNIVIFLAGGVLFLMRKRV
ncbi:MAG: LptF/LptG family permease [Spirochaetales bacterium]|nr:LptF/LptG family permease [Spirochaetales bacterium]MCF7938850.1 LptF/LptG family permease [Spirochaetales bacterium]